MSWCELPIENTQLQLSYKTREASKYVGIIIMH